MVKRPLLLHLDMVETVFKNLEPIQAFTFGAACAERQWPLYVKGSHRKPWSKEPVLREALDAIWNWLLGSGGTPIGYEAQCEMAILEKLEDYAATWATDV